MNSVKYILYFLCAVIILFMLHAVMRVVVADSFIVRGISMEPTLSDGKKIWVNKMVMGARIYKTFDFETDELYCFRMPSLGSLNLGDIVVFNDITVSGPGRIGFRINKVLAKRCVACPGDSIGIENGFYRNNHCDDVCVPYDSQLVLSETDDSVLIAKGVNLPALNMKRTGWTIRNFGPVYVPRKGDVVNIDTASIPVYAKIIRYESGRKPESGDPPYRFRQNYYFMAGDNVLDSKDSRYFGFVPESFIIGKVVGF